MNCMATVANTAKQFWALLISYQNQKMFSGRTGMCFMLKGAMILNRCLKHTAEMGCAKGNNYSPYYSASAEHKFALRTPVEIVFAPHFRTS